LVKGQNKDPVRNSPKNRLDANNGLRTNLNRKPATFVDKKLNSPNKNVDVVNRKVNSPNQKV